MKYDIHSSFFISFWESMNIIATCLFVIILLYLISLTFEKKKHAKGLILSYSIYRFIYGNIYFLLMFGVIDEIILYSILNFRSFK